MEQQNRNVTALKFETNAAALTVRGIEFGAGALCDRDPRKHGSLYASDYMVDQVRVAQSRPKEIYVSPDGNGAARGVVAIWAGTKEVGRLSWDQDTPGGTNCFDWAQISCEFSAKLRYATGPEGRGNQVTLRIERSAAIRDASRPQMTVGALGFAGF